MQPTGLFQRILAIGLLCVVANALAGTELDFWHSYTHQPSGVKHFSFHIANYKRGLFFGSCGPSTRSLQWEYEVDLAGVGPDYGKDKIIITTEGKRVEIASGTIAFDFGAHSAKIDLRIQSEGVPKDFPGNGTHRIKKIKGD